MAEYKFKINGKQYNVAVNGIEDGNADVCVNGVSYKVELENASPVAEPAAAAAQSAPVAKAEAPAAAPKAATATPASGFTVKSPLPGVIISVDVKEGQSVKRGEKIAVIEAMKMENEILAECDGTVSKIYVSKGDSVLEGAEIASIA